MVTFPSFNLFPTELQDLVWFHAANNGACIQFFYNLEPQHELSLDSDMDLIPDRQAAIRNLLNLSLACRASHAVVRRKFKALENPTILRNPWNRPCPSMSLRLDLVADIVCSRSYGIPYEWAEFSHIIFTSTRLFGVRCAARWTQRGLRIRLCEHTDRWISGDARVRACPTCLALGAVLLRKFQKLRCFYLVLDTLLPWPEALEAPEIGRYLSAPSPGAEAVGKGELFHAYRDAYFEIDPSQQAWGCDQTRPPFLLSIEEEVIRLLCHTPGFLNLDDQPSLCVKLLGRRAIV